MGFPRLTSLICLLLCPGGPALADSTALASDLPLAHEHRVFLAKVEQRGIVLNMRGFPAMKKAVLARDTNRLVQMCAETFKGVTLDPEQQRRLAASGLVIHRQSIQPGAAAVGAGPFMNYLVGLRDAFEGDPSIGLKLMALSPVDKTDIDGAWKGDGLLRLAGKRKSGGPAELMATLEFELDRVPDADAIADAAGWIRVLRMSRIQWARSEASLMADVAAARGIDPGLFQDTWSMLPARRPVVTGGVYLADVDDDGRTDVLVTDTRGLFLFRGQPGGRFLDVTDQSGLPSTARGIVNAVFGDFDNDGRVDLVLRSGVFRNVGGFRFEDISRRSNLKIPALTGFTVADYDRDGLLDLYVTRMNSAKTEKQARNSWIDGPGGPGNLLFRNKGDWQFEEVSGKANATAGNRSCFTAAWLDINNDNWPDIYVINEFGGGVLLLNQGDGTFAEKELIADAGDFGSMGMAVGDYNNDGNIDVYTANMYSKAGRRIMDNLPADSYPPDVSAKMRRFVTGSELYINKGELTFERVGQTLGVHAVGWSYGATFVDLDNDGFLDIYGTCGFVSVNKEEPDG